MTAREGDGSQGLDAEAALGLRDRLPWVVGSLMGLHACMAAVRVGACLWLLQNEYPAWSVGAMLALFALAPLALSMWAGRQADLYGLHRVVGWAVLLGAVGSGLAVLVQSPWSLALAAFLTGGALSTGAVGIQREAGLLARDAADLKRVFSWVSLGPAMSNALAPIAVGLLIDHAGFRVAFSFALAMPVLSWILVSKITRVPASPHAVEAASSRTLRSSLTLLRDPKFIRLVGCNLAMSACWDAHSFTVPVLGHARELSASAIGLVLSSFAGALMLVRLCITRWAERLEEGRALRTAMVLASLVCVSYPLMPGAWTMAMASALLGLALGSVQPMVLAMLHQNTPRHRQGEALGLRMWLTNALTLGMPLGFGVLADVAGLGGPLWLMAGLVLISLWPARRLGRGSDAV